MNRYEQAKAQLAKRVAQALPISLGFGRSEFLKRKKEQCAHTQKLERDIAAIRREAQQAAMRLFLLVRDNTPSQKSPANELPMLEDAK